MKTLHIWEVCMELYRLGGCKNDYMCKSDCRTAQSLQHLVGETGKCGLGRTTT